jgi:hypothetical protein
MERFVGGAAPAEGFTTRSENNSPGRDKKPDDLFLFLLVSRN